MAWTYTFDTATPDGATQPVSVLDDRIREVKQALQERLNIDLVMPLTGTQISDTDAGKHRKVTFYGVLSVKPTLEAGEGAVYIKTVSGVSELFYENSAGTEKQLTTAGKFNIVAADIVADLLDDTKVRLRNAQYLRGRNAAGTGDVSLIRVNSSNKPELPDGSVLATSAAPTVDAGLSNKKYVDDAKPDKYDSGWFAVAANTAYTKAHSLGAVPDTVMIYLSDSSDGSGEVTTGGWNASERCTNLADLDATNVIIRTGAYGVCAYRDSAGNINQPASGYCKIVAIKFN